MKILIADDHPLFRDAFKGILLQLHNDADITEMATFSELMSISANEYLFDMVFIDLAMPKGNAYDTISHLSNLNAEIPIIVVSGEESKDVVKNAINSGASGFLPKSLDSDSLISNLKHVLSGAMAMVSPIPVESSSPPITTQETKKSALTARQKEVLKLMCQGNTNKMIARSLDLTEGTVKLHVRAVLQALGASNRTQAVSYAKEILNES